MRLKRLSSYLTSLKWLWSREAVTRNASRDEGENQTRRRMAGGSAMRWVFCGVSLPQLGGGEVYALVRFTPWKAGPADHRLIKR